MFSRADPDAPRRRPLARIDVRLTLWFSMVFLLASLLLFSLTFMGLYRTLREQDRQDLQGRALGYILRFRTATNATVGLNLLVDEITRELIEPAGQPMLTRIATSDNETVFIAIPVPEWHDFDLRRLTMGRHARADGFLTIGRDGSSYELEFLTVKLGGDLVLQIGASTENRSRITMAFQRSFLLTFVVMLGISIVGGLFFAGRTLRPIGSLSGTIKSIVRTGELTRRIPSPQTNDDLDELTGSFNEMLDRIERLVTGLRDALDSVAHDLRTPMTRLRNTAERALSGDSQARDLREALSDVMEESEGIVAMLNAMMDISEAESGAMNLKLDLVDLTAVATSVADVYAIVADEKSMRIEISAETSVLVAGDAPRLRQVIGNLYDNAIKYGSPDSTVMVTARIEHDGLSGEPIGALLVTNSGEGVAPEDVDRIWSRFYRGAEGAGVSGLGLGLALVRAIVHAHRGEVSVSSVPGETTTFRIALPQILSEL